MITIEKRFNRYVEKDDPIPGCWRWNGAFDLNGYGLITVKGQQHKAHRYAWLMKHGSVPKTLLNRCGSYGCVNPDHWIESTPENRFWEKVEKNGPTMLHMDSECWEWQGAKDRSGYGTFYVSSRYKSAHAASYLITHGEIPNGMHVCHQCDNPSCVRPDHLWLGTPKQNVGDMVAKGRARGGANQPLKGTDQEAAKLTDEDVIAIRFAYEQGVQQKALAKDFQVSQGLISGIVNNKRWTHV